MPPTIIPVATSAASLVWNQGGISSFPPPPGNSVIDNSGFMRTLPPTPPWQGDDSLRHPLWTREGIPFPEPLVPSPFTGMSREWAATVSLLLTAGFAQIIDGAARLTDLVRVRGQGVKSRPILHLEELEWILSVHRENPRINSGVIEPVPFEDLIGPAKALGAAIAQGTASDDDKALHRRMVRSMIRRTEETIETLSNKRRPEAS